MLASEIKQLFGNLQPKKTKSTVAYFIWKKPYMSIGKDTFINDMLQRCGFINVFNAESRYPVVTEEMLKVASPEFIFLSSEPYPFKPVHFAEFNAICPNANIKVVDGEMFSWYGTRLLHAVDYFKTLTS
jgi:ABC-type Fe3+-hydroxamate transport system substrate-binding protein